MWLSLIPAARGWRFGWIPILSTGIRIHHTKRDYPKYIVFYNGGRREKRLDVVRAASFTVDEPAS